eukprot:CAMPEP_0115247028 /NCGR_PEP_ID=MMETSP0270-20121206/41335_1 /TAXON_ID=71861 /ORGANISM="Scrippsiella trochoidea, Strain CCMP3099" /LENGTH=173 /DNA_ID=CAMNT_0002662269 /DNA_START=343 /DNA_END=864 /DNA_ORIENTATION=-
MPFVQARRPGNEVSSGKALQADGALGWQLRRGFVDWRFYTMAIVQRHTAPLDALGVLRTLHGPELEVATAFTIIEDLSDNRAVPGNVTLQLWKAPLHGACYREAALVVELDEYPLSWACVVVELPIATPMSIYVGDDEPRAQAPECCVLAPPGVSGRALDDRERWPLCEGDRL